MPHRYKKQTIPAHILEKSLENRDQTKTERIIFVFNSDGIDPSISTEIGIDFSAASNEKGCNKIGSHCWMLLLIY